MMRRRLLCSGSGMDARHALGFYRWNDSLAWCHVCRRQITLTRDSRDQPTIGPHVPNRIPFSPVPRLLRTPWLSRVRELHALLNATDGEVDR